MKRLSIIVPIYNVETYVEKCLRSLEDQDIHMNDFEIICINDGSPDDSRGAVKKMQKEFDNIILIDQENQGVSRARNNGIELATGKYLLFIDPDDYIDAQKIGGILDNAEFHNADVSFLGFTFLDENGVITKRIINENNTSHVYVGTEAYFIARGDGQTDPDRMVGLLFNTDFMNRNKLRYLPDVPYLEDGEFIARILCLAERCIFNGNSFYQRTTRPGSATNSMLFYSEKANKGFMMAAFNLKRFQQEQNLNKTQKDFLNQPICKFVILVITSSGVPFNFKIISRIKKELRIKGLNKVCLDTVDSEYKKLGGFYNRSVYFLIIYQFIIYRIRFLKFKMKQR